MLGANEERSDECFALVAVTKPPPLFLPGLLCPRTRPISPPRLKVVDLNRKLLAVIPNAFQKVQVPNLLMVVAARAFVNRDKGLGVRGENNRDVYRGVSSSPFAMVVVSPSLRLLVRFSPYVHHHNKLIT